MARAPAASADVVSEPWPFTRPMVPNGLPSLVRVTVPVGVPDAAEVTLTENVTGCPNTDGLLDDVIVVVVAGATMNRAMAVPQLSVLAGVEGTVDSACCPI